ncbi:MAG: hypothetical protein SGILL_006226, partial [Bacillariaceae sp.]
LLLLILQHSSNMPTTRAMKRSASAAAASGGGGRPPAPKSAKKSSKRKATNSASASAGGGRPPPVPVSKSTMKLKSSSTAKAAQLSDLTVPCNNFLLQKFECLLERNQDGSWSVSPTVYDQLTPTQLERLNDFAVSELKRNSLDSMKDDFKQTHFQLLENASSLGQLNDLKALKKQLKRSIVAVSDPNENPFNNVYIGGDNVNSLVSGSLLPTVSGTNAYINFAADDGSVELDVWARDSSDASDTVATLLRLSAKGSIDKVELQLQALNTADQSQVLSLPMPNYDLDLSRRLEWLQLSQCALSDETQITNLFRNFSMIQFTNCTVNEAEAEQIGNAFLDAFRSKGNGVDAVKFSMGGLKMSPLAMASLVQTACRDANAPKICFGDTLGNGGMPAPVLSTICDEIALSLRQDTDLSTRLELEPSDALHQQFQNKLQQRLCKMHLDGTPNTQAMAKLRASGMLPIDLSEFESFEKTELEQNVKIMWSAIEDGSAAAAASTTNTDETAPPTAGSRFKTTGEDPKLGRPPTAPTSKAMTKPESSSTSKAKKRKSSTSSTAHGKHQNSRGNNRNFPDMAACAKLKIAIESGKDCVKIAGLRYYTAGYGSKHELPTQPHFGLPITQCVVYHGRPTLPPDRPDHDYHVIETGKTRLPPVDLLIESKSDKFINGLAKLVLVGIKDEIDVKPSELDRLFPQIKNLVLQAQAQAVALMPQASLDFKPAASVDNVASVDSLKPEASAPFASADNVKPADCASADNVKPAEPADSASADNSPNFQDLLQLFANTQTSIKTLAEGTNTSITTLAQKTDDSITNLAQKTDDSITTLAKKTDDSITTLAKKTDDSITTLAKNTDANINKLTGKVDAMGGEVSDLQDKYDHHDTELLQLKETVNDLSTSCRKLYTMTDKERQELLSGMAGTDKTLFGDSDDEASVASASPMRRSTPSTPLRRSASLRSVQEDAPLDDTNAMEFDT